MPDLEMTYEDLVKEIEKAGKRTGKATFIEAKTEFSQETYPILGAIVEFFGDRLERNERAIAELIDQTESFVQPELADQIHGMIDVGRQLAAMVVKLRVGNLDARTLKILQQAAAAFMTAANMTEESVANVTVEPAPQPGEEEEPEEGEEGDEEGDEEPTDAGGPAMIEVSVPDKPPEEPAPAAASAATAPPATPPVEGGQ